jgi:predicted DsbA family dithiol-disulfide isomerase
VASPFLATAPLQIEVHRVPFFLEPDLPEAESETEAHMMRMFRKFGNGRTYDDFLRDWPEIRAGWALDARAKEAGLDSFNEARVVSNTLASHRLVRWVAKTAGLDQSESLYTILNKQHFFEGKRLNDKVMLVDAAVEAGLDRASVSEFLDSSEGEQEVLDLVRAVHAKGIHSIPTFIIDGKYMISGAQRSEAFVEVFRMLEQQDQHEESGSIFC